jgi:hypothetical protein
MKRNAGEYPVEMKQGFGFRSGRKQNAFLQRKEALINRDPLTKELEGKVAPWNPGEDLMEAIRLLRERIEKKWAVRIFFTKGAHIDSGEDAVQPYPDSYGPLIVSHGYPGRTEVLRAFRFNSETKYRHRVESSVRIKLQKLSGLRNHERLGKSKKLPNPQRMLPTDDKLLIEIDLNLCDKGEDAKFLKKEVASLIDVCLEQRKWEGRKPVVTGEPDELSFLYHCKDKTFQNYLRWYDIHTNEKISFRLIAAMEKSKSASQFLERIKKRKFKWGIPVKGEDNVQKGVKLVYKAIYRTEYSPKKIRPMIEEYNCPKHGMACPPGCKYGKDWSDTFDCLMPVELPKNLVSMEKSDKDDEENKNLDHPIDRINLQRLQRFKGRRIPPFRPA